MNLAENFVNFVENSGRDTNMMPGSDQIAKKENIRTMTEYEVHYLGTRPPASIDGDPHLSNL